MDVELLQKEFIKQGKTLALAESCTGGAVAARLVQTPGASKYLLGSMVVYHNSWKERFLKVRRSTLEEKSAVSQETAIEMALGLLDETEADYVAAITGNAEKEGEIYIVIGKRGDSLDVGKISLQKDRLASIQETTEIVLNALWQRLVHHKKTLR